MFNLYLSLNFLIKLSKKAQDGYSYFEKDKNQLEIINLLDLMFSNETLIKTDATLNQLNEDKSNQLFRTLLKNKPDKIHFNVAINDFNNTDKYIPIQDNIAVFFSDIFTNEKTKKLEDNYGYYFNNLDTSLNRLFEVNSFNFLPNSAINDWGFSNDFLLPMNSMVIVDPYLYKKETLKSLEKLLMSVISKNFKGNYHITLIGNCVLKSGSTVHYKQSLIKNFKNFVDNIHLTYPELSIKIEQLFVDTEKLNFHDRYILSNNSMVFLTYGLDLIKNNNQIKKDSTWLGFPPFFRLSLNGLKGIYLNTLKIQKLEILKKWSESDSIINPMFKEINN